MALGSLPCEEYQTEKVSACLKNRQSTEDFARICIRAKLPPTFSKIFFGKNADKTLSSGLKYGIMPNSWTKQAGGGL